MGRLRTIGYEIRGMSATILEGALNLEGDIRQGTVTFDATTVRSGTASMRCNSDIDNTIVSTQLDLKTAETALGRNHYVRVYINISAYPIGNRTIIYLSDAGSAGAYVVLTSSGRLQLWSTDIVQRGSDSEIITPGRWYRVELNLLLAAGANDACALRLDGTPVGSATGLNLGLDNPVIGLGLGWIGTAPGASKSIYFDDLAWNDDQGASQNSWPGEGKIVKLIGISDNQRGSWTGGVGGTTNLFDAANNTPPIGTATETDLTQIESADSSGDNSTDEYRMNMTIPSVAGVDPEDTITVMQAVVDHGEDAAAGTKTGSFLILSNPAQSVADTFTFGDDIGALGTWPTNWRAKWGQAQYNPTVNVNISPVMRVRKTDAAATVGSVDFMGIMVEYQDNVPFMQPMAGLLSPILAE